MTAGEATPPPEAYLEVVAKWSKKRDWPVAVLGSSAQMLRQLRGPRQRCR